MSHIPLRVSATAVILLSIAMISCDARDAEQDRQASTPEPSVIERSGDDKIAVVDVPSKPAREVVIVEELTLGDRACYMQVKSAQGETREEFAVMELCERRELIGRSVRLSHETGSIAAESCQGNPECAESETVQLVRDVEVLP